MVVVLINQTLKTAATTDTMLKYKRLYPSENFMEMEKTTSRMPEIITTSHANAGEDTVNTLFIPNKG